MTLKARRILDIGDDEIITEEFLKRKYRIKALQFHPDKNPSPDASEQFQEIHAAFEILAGGLPSPLRPPCSVDSSQGKGVTGGNRRFPLYMDILSDFLKSMSSEDTELVGRILKMVDRRSLETIRDVLSGVVLRELNGYLSRCEPKRNLETQCIVLKPTLSDLFADNLYKLTFEEQQFLIPLWYDELVYDISGADLIVRCCPELPSDVVIDTKNNITISVRLVAGNLIGKSTYDISVCGRIFTICPSELKLVPLQTVVLKNVGISQINRRDIYNVAERANVILRIELT
jgi:hypothetical protein